MFCSESRTPPRIGEGSRRIVARLVVALLTTPLFPVFAADAEPVRDLSVGDPDRRILLDLLRPVLELEMRGPVEFRVDFARTLKGWGLVRVEPQRPGGRPIGLRETVFGDGDIMDGLTTDALFRRHDDRWYLITHVVGPTDAASSNWIFGAVPERLFMPEGAGAGNLR